MMMNNMDGYRRIGQVKKPRNFDYDRDLIIQDGMGAEKLVLADSAWCEPDCAPPSFDPGYMDTADVFKAFALDSSYHVLWTPQSGRPAEGSVVMPAGDYVAYFALTENKSWWRGVFLSENPLEFTISD